MPGVDSTPCSSIPIVNFEHVIAGWERLILSLLMAWSSILKLLKVASLQYLYNISKKS